MSRSLLESEVGYDVYRNLSGRTDSRFCLAWVKAGEKREGDVRVCTLLYAFISSRVVNSLITARYHSQNASVSSVANPLQACSRACPARTMQCT